MSTTAHVPTRDIPPAVQRYIDAVHSRQLDTLVGCFTPDAVIIDVNRRIEGAAQIRRWADQEVVGGRYEVLDSVREGDSQRFLVRFTPPGESTGFRANYTLRFRDDRIVLADLQYA